VDVVRLASRFGRYGYRQITNLLRIEGWQVNHKRVERIWRQEGLKVPRRQPKRTHETVSGYQACSCATARPSICARTTGRRVGGGQLD
jgi:transposase InsO family protein